MDNWIQIYPAPGTVLFNQIYQKVLKDERFQYPSEGHEVSLVNKARSEAMKTEIRESFKIDIQWMGDEVCGIDVYKKVG